MSQLLLAAAAGLALAACCPDRGPTTPPAEAPLPAAPAPTRALSAPAGLSPAVIAEERRRLVAGTSLEALPERPTVSDPGPVVIEEDPERAFIHSDDFTSLVFHGEPEPGAVGREVMVHARLFAREPSATVGEDGNLTVRFETTRTVTHARLYVGAAMRTDPLGLPRYRGTTAAVAQDGTGRRHAMSFDATRGLLPRYDAAGARAAGRGVLAYRLELLDEEASTSRLWDGRVAFRCAETPCAEEAPRLVQLPTFRLGPVVDLVGPDRATVSFSTDGATAAVVLLRAEQGGELHRFESPSEGGTHHEVPLTALAPSTRYGYTAIAVDRRGEVVSSRPAAFTTAPAPGASDPLTFVMLSDARSGIGAGEESFVGTNRRVLHGLLLRAMDEDPSFVVFVGDLVDGFTTEPSAYRFELEAFLRVTEPFAAFVPVYEAVGNHETLARGWDAGWAMDRSGAESAEALFAEVFVNPDNGPPPHRPEAPTYLENTYSFDHGAVHVAVVNSNYWFRSHMERQDHPAAALGQREGWLDDTTLEWLDADLAEARGRGAQHLIVATHEPAFPCGGHAKDAMYWHGRIPEVLAMRDRFIQLLGRHGVALLFTGDEHNYSRTLVDEQLVEGLERPLWQVISGGAGAPYYAQDTSLPWTDHVRVFDERQHFVAFHVDGESLTAEAVSLEGAPVDRFDVTTAE